MHNLKYFWTILYSWPFTPTVHLDTTMGFTNDNNLQFLNRSAYRLLHITIKPKILWFLIVSKSEFKNYFFEHRTNSNIIHSNIEWTQMCLCSVDRTKIHYFRLETKATSQIHNFQGLTVKVAWEEAMVRKSFDLLRAYTVNPPTQNCRGNSFGPLTVFHWVVLEAEIYWVV